MISEASKETFAQGVCGMFATVASTFLQATIAHMIPWLMASFAVIMCDLAFGIRKSLLMSEEVRISSAVRRTMGKMVTYFAFVCMVCMIEVSMGGGYGIDKWSCLLVCGIEFCSIVSNILKPKGYSLNVKVLVAAVLGKVFKTGKEEFNDIIEETKEKEEKK